MTGRYGLEIDVSRAPDTGIFVYFILFYSTNIYLQSKLCDLDEWKASSALTAAGAQAPLKIIFILFYFTVHSSIIVDKK
jgi:hypothetical protein